MVTEDLGWRRRPTMSDVAARAGVSPKSVSRVINGEPHVSPDVAARVGRAIADLDYRPDRRARDLASSPRTGRMIGYVQADAANPFFGAVSRGLEDVLIRRGLAVVTGSTDADPDREAALVHSMIEFRVEGLVVAAAEGSDALLQREAARGTPIVLVDRVIPDLACDVVVSRNRESTRQAVMHLLGRGHRRIAFLGGNPAVWTAAERLAGFAEAFAEAGGGVSDELVVMGVDTVALSAAATRTLLTGTDPPTAIFSAQDRITMGAVTALHQHGVQHEVAMFGFDEVPLAEQLVPSVAVVAQDPYEMGRQAGVLLLDRLSDGPAPPPRRIVLDAPLRVRASADIRPGVVR